MRDVAAAYAAAMALAPDRTETYNVGTGEPVTVERILQILVRLSRVPVRTEVDPDRVREGDATVLALDASRFRARAGWRPTVPLERSLGDTLDHWRVEVQRSSVALRA